MRKKKIYSLSIKSYLLAFLLITFSCSKSDDANDPEESQEPLIGTWKTYYTQLTTYENGEKQEGAKEYFDDTEYSTLEFKEDGNVIEIDYSNSEVIEIEEVSYETVSDTLYIHWGNNETEATKFSIINDELHLLFLDEINDGIESNEEYTEVYKRQ